MTTVLAVDLGYSYEAGRPVLTGVDFAAKAGESVGIMGPNGSGKSTMLRILARAAKPDAGTLTVGATLRETAVALDSLPFAESLSGVENVTTSLALRGIPPAAAGPAADRSIAALGLAERAADPVSSYSMGMRRRLALAEATAAPDATRLLLLDEPTLGLDVEGGRTLARLVRDAAGRGGAVVLASNDPAFVSESCDRVLFLHEGRVALKGRPPDLIAGLGRSVAIEVDAGPAPTPVDVAGLPPGLDMLSSAAPTFRFAAEQGTASLPALCEWLARTGQEVRAIRIREPDLSDVFLGVTGVALDPGRIEAGT